jgi:tripartite motif-containing protein 71
VEYERRDIKMKYKHVNLFRITSICLTILFLGLMSASIIHAETYQFVTKWGSYGGGNGQFYSSHGVAVDSSGNVYVADGGNNRIQKFDSNGTFLTKWGLYGSGDGQFKIPRYIAVDSSGNVYVVDVDNHRIQKFDSNGNFITKWVYYFGGDEKNTDPRGIAVDSSGNVYVVDFNLESILKFESNGNSTTYVGKGQLHSPNCLAVDPSGNVYVVDGTLHCIKKFDSNGNYLTVWGSYGGGNGQFNNPQDIAVDSSGNVYVADGGNNRIQKFDSSGNFIKTRFITTWGSYGGGDGQIYDPLDIAVDSSGNVYVLDANGIEKFAINDNAIVIGVAIVTDFIKSMFYSPAVTPKNQAGISSLINITNLITAILAGIIVSFFAWFIHDFLKDRKEKQRPKG